MSVARDKGTAAETAVVRWARANGFPWADRGPLRGAHDQGDVTLCPGVIAEVKSHAGAASVGQPAQAQLASWMAETETERANAEADIAILVVKRKGTSDVGRWWVYVPAWVLTGGYDPRPAQYPVQAAFGHLAGWLRSQGWGEPL